MAQQPSLGPDRRESFVERHLGPRPGDREAMLAALGLESLEELVERCVPDSIRLSGPLGIGPGATETEALTELRAMAAKNRILRSYIGLGYHGTVVPGVILRNVLENPGWYTQYTPYQAEISQGRLEALLVFQTMIADLTGMEIANASMLDEATSAAEAMTLCHRVLARGKTRRNRFFADANCHPQTLAVVNTRAEALGLEVVVGDWREHEVGEGDFGVLVQYPDTTGEVHDYRAFAARAREKGALVVAAADLLGLCLLTPPGEWGADVVVGSSQRFGVPMGFGGPHAAFLATREAFKRQMPGRVIGVTRDASGGTALRMALQTREQHIRRERATSNICTAQVLLAIMAGMYAVYHGPEGLRAIAERLRAQCGLLAEGLRGLGVLLETEVHFDTLTVRPNGVSGSDLCAAARKKGINLRDFGDGRVGISLDETVEDRDLLDLFAVFGGEEAALRDLADRVPAPLPEGLERTSSYLEHPVFHRYRSETEMLRYLHRLQAKDLSLTGSMIPLGSCTMKLNATVEMAPVSWPEFAELHPFAPPDQTEGYRELLDSLEAMLCRITGFSACSMQPNAGSQGEYTGLQVIRAWHESRGEGERRVCLIPSSAHGTNPASAVLAGMEVVVVDCDEAGNIDLSDLEKKAEAHAGRLAALMVTYPSTHGVFEEGIRDLCGIVHRHGGQVYLDGANLNALVGLARPGDFGADVCHLNLHKTFCIPHGGGGPGMGPICCAAHLAPFLPGHPLVACGGERAIGPVAAAPFGSPSILPISWVYIRMMGDEGLRLATEVAILNANYVACRLEEAYPVLYKGAGGFVAHECILDPRVYEESAGVTVGDFAKRLMDYGFHAPTMSWPVPGTLMVEPTESESKEELDRFCEAMLSIREEIREIEEGAADRERNLLKGAPHSSRLLARGGWDRPYPLERAYFPSRAMREAKYWPPVGRVDEVFGDRNLRARLPEEETRESSPR